MAMERMLVSPDLPGSPLYSSVSRHVMRKSSLTVQIQAHAAEEVDAIRSPSHQILPEQEAASA